MDKLVIFGAGAYGRRAAKKYGAENIAFFIDNNMDKKGQKCEGIEIYCVSEVINQLLNYHVIIASRQWESMKSQLDELGISNYEIYGMNSYFDMPDLIYNPYVASREQDRESLAIDINARVHEIVQEDQMLFDHVEIETVNRCNGVCDFCPVNKNVDSRKLTKMSSLLFTKIIDELAEMNYSGRLALFSNNEPFIDDRILEFHKYARKKLPDARMHLCTNGTLLTVDCFVELMNYLDELIIDNYDEQLHLIPSVNEIYNYCKDKEVYTDKVTIVLRKPHEVLTNRGGDAPNKGFENACGTVSCLMPFKQLIIRPSGEVSLCCNDALGKSTLGDINKQTLTEVWYGEKFKSARRLLTEGRASYERCKNCDTLYIC